MKISKRLRKLVAAVMAALIINIAVFSPALEVQASDEPAEATTVVYPIVQALLEILGIANGLGASYEGMSGINSDIAKDMIDKWTAGESLQMGEQTIPDLRDVDNMSDFLYNLKLVYDAHIDGSNPIDYLIKMDAKSYAASGTLYSKTMQASLALALENLTEEVNTSFWNTILNDSTSNLDAEFDFKTTALLFDALMAGTAAYAGDVADFWSEAITSTEYDFNEINTSIYNYNGVNYQIVKTSNVKMYISENQYYELRFSEPVYVFFTPGINGWFFSLEKYQVTYENYTNGKWSEYTTFECPYYSSHCLYVWSYGGSFNYVDYPMSSNSSTNINTYLPIMQAYLAQVSPVPEYMSKSNGMTSEVTDALSSFGAKRVTGTDAVTLANNLVGIAGTTAGTLAGVSTIADTIAGTASVLPDVEVDAGTGEYSGILGKIFDIMKDLAAAIGSYFATPLTAIKELITTIPASIATVFEDILTIPQTLVDDLAVPLEDIRVNTQAIADSMTAVDAKEPNNGHSNDYRIIFSALIILIMILIKLLMIFFHCMEFIIAIFAIPAGTAFLPEEMVMGLDYVKSLMIPGIGMSVYAFMLGLVYIFIVFYVIRTLRMNIEHLKMPGRK